MNVIKHYSGYTHHENVTKLTIVAKHDQLGSKDSDLFNCSHCHSLLVDTCSALENEVEWEFADTKIILNARPGTIPVRDMDKDHS